MATCRECRMPAGKHHKLGCGRRRQSGGYVIQADISDSSGYGSTDYTDYSSGGYTSCDTDSGSSGGGCD